MAYRRPDRACAVYLSAGVVWLSYSASIPLLQAILIGVAPFIIGDALKLLHTIGRRVA